MLMDSQEETREYHGDYDTLEEERLLAADVPHEKVDVLADDFLDVGANCGRRVDHLVHEKLIKNRCLPSVVLTTKRHNRARR